MYKRQALRGAHAQSGADGVQELFVSHCPAHASSAQIRKLIQDHLAKQQKMAHHRTAALGHIDANEAVVSVEKAGGPPQYTQRGNLIPAGSDRYITVRGTPVAAYLCVESCITVDPAYPKVRLPMHML